jgi:RNA polymerase sigma factor (sigma-70 family)
MKITDPGAEALAAATTGDLAALDQVLLAIQPGIYNLAVRVLGQRDDAADATQEILLKVVTHLGSFRGESAFATWVWRVAHNHLMTARTRIAETPEVSLEGLAERLGMGLELAANLARARGEPAPLTPQDKLEARQVALACTQSMLMALDREQRLIYVLDTVFDFPSRDAAAVVGITPEAYRQRLSRIRARMESFMGRTCGLANAEAACSCERQLPAIRHVRGSERIGNLPVVALQGEALKEAEREAERHFAAFTRVSEAAAIFRGHPVYRAPEAMRAAIRAVLTQEGFLQRQRPQ